MTTTTAADLVLAELRGAVLVLTLNRPGAAERLERRARGAYFERLDEAEDDPEVRAIVVTGAGRGFCAGADMEDLERGHRRSDADDCADATAREHGPSRSTVRKPMIAAINGAAAGLGLVEALYCDIRFATPQAKLTTAFARRGLIAEYGMAWMLPRLVGPSRALDLLLSGRIVLRRGGAPARAGRPPRASPKRSSTMPWPTRPGPRRRTARPGRWRRSRPRSWRTSTAASRRPSRPPTSSCSRRSTSRTSRRACAATSSGGRRRSPALRSRKERDMNFELTERGKDYVGSASPRSWTSASTRPRPSTTQQMRGVRRPALPSADPRGAQGGGAQRAACGTSSTRIRSGARA